MKYLVLLFSLCQTMVLFGSDQIIRSTHEYCAHLEELQKKLPLPTKTIDPSLFFPITIEDDSIDSFIVDIPCPLKNQICKQEFAINELQQHISRQDTLLYLQDNIIKNNARTLYMIQIKINKNEQDAKLQKEIIQHNNILMPFLLQEQMNIIDQQNTMHREIQEHILQRFNHLSPQEQSLSHKHINTLCEAQNKIVKQIDKHSDIFRSLQGIVNFQNKQSNSFYH